MDEQLKLKKNTTDTPKLEPVQGTAPPLSITLNFVTLKSFILNPLFWKQWEIRLEKMLLKQLKRHLN